MVAFSRYMTQDATYWAPAGNDGFGGTSFESPVLIKCRWEDKAVLFRDTQAREVVSDAVVYPNRSVQVGGYLALGSYPDSDPRGVAAAREIRQAGQSPSLSGAETLNKAWL